MNKVYCNDGCGRSFTISNLTTGVDHYENGIEKHYIKCPNCSQKYTSYYLNDSMKTIQQEIITLRNKPNPKAKQKNRIIKLTKRMHTMSKQLRLQVERGEVVVK